MRSDPGVGTFDFDRHKPGIPGINSEAVTKSVPRGFLKVMLLEKGMKFSFVLIAIIRYFTLLSKQIIGPFIRGKIRRVLHKMRLK